MLDPQPDPDELVTLTTRPTEFEAHALVAVLEEEGIPAFAFGAMHAALPLSGKLSTVPVQVKRTDLERAKAALSQNVADSVDLDWDEVDVGDRVDDLPLTQRDGLPLVPRAGFLVAVAIFATMLALYLAWLAISNRPTP